MTRKHSSASVWITATLVAMLVGYPLTMGPACWISSRIGGEKIVSTAYRPVVNVCATTSMMKSAVYWYSNLAAQENWHWIKVDWDDASSPPRWRWATADF